VVDIELYNWTVNLHKHWTDSGRQFWLITAARTSAQFWWVWYLEGRRSVPLGGLSPNFSGPSCSCGKRQCLAGDHLEMG